MKRFRELSPGEIRDFTMIYDYMNIKTRLPKRADAIVVGGAGTRVDMAERAAELYLENRAPIIVFSGFAHPAFGVNEANLLAEKAIELGVPELAILRETRATNTGLNIQLSAEILRQKDAIPKNVILIHRPFMTRRFLATAQKQWPSPQPEFFVTSANYTFVEYLAREDENNLADRSMAAMLRYYAQLDEYFERGFATRQSKNAKVEAAFRRLIASGFEPLARNDDLATDKFVKYFSL